MLSKKYWSTTMQEIDNLTLAVENDSSYYGTEHTLHANTHQDNNEERYHSASGKTMTESPFNMRYRNLAESVKVELLLLEDDEKQDKHDNPHYSPGIANYVIKYLMPLVPMWTALMRPYHSVYTKQNRLTNANVENYFGQVKTRVLEGKTFLKVGRLVRKLKENIEMTLLSVDLGVNEMNRKKRKQRSMAINRTVTHSPSESNVVDVDDPTIEERWSKRAKRPETYFDTQTFALRTNEKDVTTESVILTYSDTMAVLNKEEVKDYDCTPVNNDKLIVADAVVQNLVHSVCSEVLNTQTDEITSKLTYPHPCAMDNGLFINPGYYTDVPINHDYAVSTYRNIGPRSTLLLYGAAYSSLYGDRRLHQNVVDACIISLIRSLGKSASMKYVNIATCYSLFRKSLPTVASRIWYNFSDIKQYDVILMPYLVPGADHYCLIIADLKQKQCFFLNSLRCYPDSSQEGFIKFKKFLNALNKTEYGNQVTDMLWHYGSPECTQQTDNFNCGVYVVHYIQCFIMEKSYNDNICPVTYRDYLRRLCLRYSDDVKDDCLYCGKGTTRCEDWVMCDLCKRWLHYKPCSGIDVPVEITKSDEFTFQCVLCQQYEDKHANEEPWI